MISNFPVGFDSRATQNQAIDAIEVAVKAGKKFILLEAPVGVGKSHIAMTIANWSKSAFIVMPKKNLQAQYRDTFEGDIRLTKGRSAIPCTYGRPEDTRKLFKIISAGGDVPIPHKSNSCSEAPCTGVTTAVRNAVLRECLGDDLTCPYKAMILEACTHRIVVANMHSFFYQTYYGDNFPPRKVLIIDECHNVEGFLRELLGLKFNINRIVLESEVKHLKTRHQWINWLKQDEQFHTIPDKGDNRQKYLARLELFENSSAEFGDFVISKPSFINKEKRFTVEFVPVYVGNAFHRIFKAYADIVVFMSGTIYDKGAFLNPLGISADDAAFIRLPSDFPAENRPVVLPRKLNLDLSQKHWEENFEDAIKEMQRIIDHHHDEKGIIHAPSYSLMTAISAALNRSGRVITHNQEDFSLQLDRFYKSTEPKILLSPVVKEGFDFKNDLARWQIIVRPPYAPINDPFVAHQIEHKRWSWYQLRALIDVGQTCGRIVRSNEDYGTTYLLDARFHAFFKKNAHLLPNWFKAGLIK